MFCHMQKNIKSNQIQGKQPLQKNIVRWDVQDLGHKICLHTNIESSRQTISYKVLMPEFTLKIIFMFLVCENWKNCFIMNSCNNLEKIKSVISQNWQNIQIYIFSIKIYRKTIDTYTHSSEGILHFICKIFLFGDLFIFFNPFFLLCCLFLLRRIRFQNKYLY